MGILGALLPIGDAVQLVSQVLRPNPAARHVPVAQPTKPSFGEELEAARARAETLMRLYDADGDQRLNLTESGMAQQAFARNDMNGDGLLDVTELTQSYLRQP